MRWEYLGGVDGDAYDQVSKRIRNIPKKQIFLTKNLLPGKMLQGQSIIMNECDILSPKTTRPTQKASCVETRNIHIGSLFHYLNIEPRISRTLSTSIHRQKLSHLNLQQDYFVATL